MQWFFTSSYLERAKTETILNISVFLVRQCRRRAGQRSAALSLPFVRYRKWKKKWALFERSEFRPLPIFCNAQTGTPKGQDHAVAFLCLLSLAKQRK
jgi:hypothetical protein